MKQSHSLLRVAFLASAVLSGLSYADTVKISGATTVQSVVVNPHRAAVEKATGHTLEINANATGKGLVDLTEGKADASMCSEPIDVAVAAAAVAGKAVDPKTLQFSVIRNDEIVFIVHPNNPVSKLTWEQIADIHTGKIKNWKQVGGKDLAITVYSDAITGGTRAMVKKVVMNDAEYAPGVKSLTNVARVADFVPGDESSIGGIGKGFVNAKSKVIDTKKIERPLGFVTLGAPSAKVAAVIAAFKTEVGNSAK